MANHKRAKFSARSRIVGWMLLLVVLALGGAIVMTWQVVSLRADDMAEERRDVLTENFRSFARSETAAADGTVPGILMKFLQSIVPARSETMFTIVDGATHRRLPGALPVRLDLDEEFVTRVSALDQAVNGTLHRPEVGTIQYSVTPLEVKGDTQRGQLVVVIFEDELADPLFEAVRLFAFVSIGALALAALAGWLVAGRVLMPIRQVRSTAERISETDLTRRIDVRGRDDVADLAATFNHMLDRLEAAFASQRRFVDDAGHELRTPITVIRGHLELMGDDEAERAHTMELVTNELARMQRIVEELLLLARAEQSDFIQLEPVNLTDLTVDIFDHARVLGERKWSIAEVAEATVEADAQRLTQALMQLAANAVRYTEEGDSIAIGSRVQEDRVLLWVSDTGRGIDPAEVSTIFERFQRGQRRRGEGAGLGLPIVRSIARAHGGDVEVRSEPGHGAQFLLDIPAQFVGDSPLDPAEEVNMYIPPGES